MKTLLLEKDSMSLDIPRIGCVYNCFDDGKITESRRYSVYIQEIIPFRHVNKSFLEFWGNEKKRCHWLYRETTDFFIRTIDLSGSEEIFVRTQNDGWFGLDMMNNLSFNCGRLDINGELYKMINY